MDKDVDGGILGEHLHPKNTDFRRGHGAPPLRCRSPARNPAGQSRAISPRCVPQARGFLGRLSGRNFEFCGVPGGSRSAAEAEQWSRCYSPHGVRFCSFHSIFISFSESRFDLDVKLPA